MSEPQKRPWCYWCPSWAAEAGVACEWHWFVLTAETKAAVTDEVRRLHPRGGRVSRVTEQAWVTRSSISNARQEWAIRDEFEGIEDAGGDPGEWLPFLTQRKADGSVIVATGEGGQ